MAVVLFYHSIHKPRYITVLRAILANSTAPPSDAQKQVSLRGSGMSTSDFYLPYDIKWSLVILTWGGGCCVPDVGSNSRIVSGTGQLCHLRVREPRRLGVSALVIPGLDGGRPASTATHWDQHQHHTRGSDPERSNSILIPTKSSDEKLRTSQSFVDQHGARHNGRGCAAFSAPWTEINIIVFTSIIDQKNVNEHCCYWCSCTSKIYEEEIWMDHILCWHHFIFVHPKIKFSSPFIPHVVVNLYVTPS